MLLKLPLSDNFLTPKTRHGKIIEIPNGLIVHIIKYSYIKELAKVSKNLASVMLVNPIAKLYFMPSLSIRYPLIVSP
jgi:hypothetical protein